MKNYKEKLKSEKGSITSIVLVTILFFITILSTAYAVTATQRKSQLKSEIAVKGTYEKDLDNVDEILSNVCIVAVNVKASKNSTINKEASSANNPTIPEGYTPINTDTTSWGDGTTAPSQESVDKGLVIKDDNGNEWVWVPVPDVRVMYVSEDEPIALSGDTGITTTKYSKEIISGQTRKLPGSTAYREPDLVTDYDDDSTAQTAGFADLADMATKLVIDYETMIASIEKYHGFYIGRYELTANGEKAGPTLTQKSWYQLYANCKSLSKSDQAITRMIWGCQWDVTCKWLASNGYDITDSRSWGNYSDSTEPANTGNYRQNTKRDTGSNEAWKANNIYDFAGNCYEWTQEADRTNYRARRGGSAYHSGSNTSASFRNFSSPTLDDNSVHGSRSTLIINPEG